ncbi:ATP-binding protein [Faucicola atlantae]|uniref:ATPase AAA-type core domain-containing protein n=1 Tax=Faucicola atlantae TaxID=34059 RepID=A0A1B8QKZ4_9GAMM|nr:ATP-binding protein [Moraxella atlantae]OBX84255.1 hypothetical protein A9306_03710 [Moraxella atlantae]
MLFTHLYIDNLFSFKHASFDLTYVRPVQSNTIPHEYLAGRPKFYVRKVCILSGANASGKTSLGTLLNFVQNFVVLQEKAVANFHEHIYHKDKPAQLVVEFATPKSHYLHRLQLDFLPKQNTIGFAYAQVAIGDNDSVSMVRKRLDKVWQQQTSSKTALYLTSDSDEKYPVALSQLFEVLKKEVACGWLYVFSNNELSQNLEHTPNTSLIDINVLKAVLQTFDKSITDVLASRDDLGENGYSIKFGNHDTVLMDLQGKIANPERLSKGTYDAIMVAEFISRVINDYKDSQLPDTYFLDEKMAFAHSELEQAIVNLIIEKLQPSSQFFYTTHNYDILEMNLPIHSYVFLKKDDEYSQFVQPETLFKKNDRKLLNYVKNDVFNTLPDTTAIDELL